MLKRKNNDISYNTTNNNQSPYRFERKNPNLSPGLSPMRCRTPTRGNVSPFRVAPQNDNLRGHSPIKFVSSKVTNLTNMGFFRQQNPSTFPLAHNQKYATYANNNDHSIRRQSLYEHENSYRNKGPHQNSQRMMFPQDTNLFSKLVSKLNSEKKKQPQMVRRHTKPEIYKPVQKSVEQKSITYQKVSKHKNQPQKLRTESISGQIKPVESVAYEEKQTKIYSQKQHTLLTKNGKQNKTFYQQQTYKVTQQTHTTTNKTPNSNKKQRINDCNIQARIPSSTKTNDQKERSFKKQKYNVDTDQFSNNQRKISEFGKPSIQQDNAQFDDVRMYLDKLKDSFAFGGFNKDDSIGNYSDYKNVNMSMMNMDPFV